MKMIELKAFSHSGKDKDNEDYALCHRLSDNSLVAVLADGMGGLSYGACAAKIISDSILATVIDKIQGCSPEDVLRIVQLVEDRRKDATCRGKTI